MDEKNSSSSQHARSQIEHLINNMKHPVPGCTNPGSSGSDLTVCKKKEGARPYKQRAHNDKQHWNTTDITYEK